MSEKAWFTTDKVNESTYIISQYRHSEETHCYLLCGSEKALLIDTELGVGNIYDEIDKLTDKPVAVATHIKIAERTIYGPFRLFSCPAAMLVVPILVNCSL